jgi:inositol-phosphate phosphatase/L-galactose 1-phosphate phosphatase/histidinol-phosphatase
MIDEDVVLAERLADAAREAIRPYFRADHGIEHKSDSTPVTLADRAAEAAMRAILTEHRPQDGIVGEEFGTERGEASRCWVLDPIDGTRSFIAGRAIFGTLIALIEDGTPIIGVIDQPIRGLVLGGDCYAYATLALGQLDLVVEEGLKLHDFAALVPVVEGAGGLMRDWSGRPLNRDSDGRVVAAGDPALLEAALAILAG